MCALFDGPGLERVIGKRIVAILTGEVRTTTLYLNRDDIKRRVVVGAAGLRIDADSANLGHHFGNRRVLPANPSSS